MYTMTPKGIGSRLIVDGHRYEFTDCGPIGTRGGVHVLDCETGGWTWFGADGGIWRGTSPGGLHQTVGTWDSPRPPRDSHRLRRWLRAQLRATERPRVWSEAEEREYARFRETELRREEEELWSGPYPE